MAEQRMNGGSDTVRAEFADRVDQVREFADDARERAEGLIASGKELVLRYPAYAVAGAVAAGFLFARFVRRR